MSETVKLLLFLFASGTVGGVIGLLIYDSPSKKSRQVRPRRSRNRITEVADMNMVFTGSDYEYYVAGQLRIIGFKGVKVTQESGDYGADIIARKKRKLYVFQCKYYSRSVGVSAVQEVLGAMGFYEADEGIVVTNSYFTKAAKSLAQSNGIKLWDNFY